MRSESLINSVVSIMAGQEVTPPSPELMPDVNDDVQIHLGKPDPVIKEVRDRIAYLQKLQKAELTEQLADLEERRKAEIAIVKEGEASVASLMKAGKTREQIIEARSASSVAQELADSLDREIDAVQDQINKIDREWRLKRDRVMTSLEQIETAARGWMLDFVQGGNQNRLNPDRPVRAYRAMLQREQFISEVLEDDDLSSRAVLACATFVCPDNVYDTLFAVMPDRYHKDFEDDQPDTVLARLNSAISTNSGEAA